LCSQLAEDLRELAAQLLVFLLELAGSVEGSLESLAERCVGCSLAGGQGGCWCAAAGVAKLLDLGADVGL